MSFFEEAEVDKDKHCIYFRHKDQVLTIPCRDPYQAMCSELFQKIIALTGEDESLVLRCFDFLGTELFQLAAPEGYEFYYLKNHHYAEIAVVCSKSIPFEGRQDWHFQILLKDKSLRRLCPAY